MMGRTSGNSSYMMSDYEDYDSIDSQSDLSDVVSNTDTVYPCFSLEKEDFQLLQNVDYSLNGIVGLPIAILGIIINIFCFSVLFGKGLRKVLFNQLLISLSVINVVALIVRIIRVLDKTFNLHVYVHITLFPYLIYPLQSISLTATIYMTVAIIHERWSVVANSSRTIYKSNKIKKLGLYLGAVLTIALIINLPKFFEVTWAEFEGSHYLKTTSMRTNPYYSIFYICWTRLVFWKIIPNGLLIFFCFKIFRAVRMASNQCENQNEVLNHERRLSYIFMVMVLAFFLCYLPANFLNINEAVNIKQLVYCHQRHRNGLAVWVLCLTDVSNFCLYLYSSVNLLFVLLPSSGYREQCLAMLKCRGRNLDAATRDDISDAPDAEVTEIETQFDCEITTAAPPRKPQTQQKQVQQTKNVTSEEFVL